jgi:Raf kinase inhibitor-like YbhB/YbcL family protein
MKLTSPAFADGQPIAAEYTREGQNVSPPLEWSDLPAGTVQLALIVDDPDAPRPEPFVHWVIFAIPSDLSGLPRGVAKQAQLHDLEAVQGTNDFGEIGYDGPQPPAGTGEHRYRFELFALDRALDADAKIDHKALRAAMAGAILERTMLTGVYRSVDELA